MVVVPCLYWSTTRKERAITDVKEKTTMIVYQGLISTHHHKDDEPVRSELMKDGMHRRLLWTVLKWCTNNSATVWNARLRLVNNISSTLLRLRTFKWRIQGSTELTRLSRVCDDLMLLNTWYFLMHGHKAHAHARKIQLCSSQETWLLYTWNVRCSASIQFLSCMLFHQVVFSSCRNSKVHNWNFKSTWNEHMARRRFLPLKVL